jgi:hypothetical protein
MAKVLEAVPLERIRAEAREVHLGRTLLTLLVGVFWLIGWLAGKATLAVGFAYASAKIGFQEARNPTGGPRRGPA